MCCLGLGSWCVLGIGVPCVELSSEINVWLDYIFLCGCVCGSVCREGMEPKHPCVVGIRGSA